MLLIAEIILTYFAWKKGWRWWAILPVALCVVIGLILGIGIASSGGSVNDLPGVAVILDIVAIIALIVMVSIKPKSLEND
jgi:hypothetical protein